MIPLSARSKVEAALARQAAVALEVEPTDLTRLWLRGGFPDSFLSATDGDSLDLRESFIRTYLERDVPMFGPRIPAETLRRLWTMLAHNQGTLLNASRLAWGLSRGHRGDRSAGAGGIAEPQGERRRVTGKPGPRRRRAGRPPSDPRTSSRCSREVAGLPITVLGTG